MFNPQIPVAWSPALSALPDNCEPELLCSAPEAPCWNDCSLLVGTESTVRNQFQEGYQRVLTEEAGEAYAAFVPVADLWQPELPGTYSDFCRVFIQAARSLTEGEAFEGGWRATPPGHADPMLRIQPNPSADMTTVQLPPGLCRVRVYDRAGVLWFETLAENDCRLETSGWPAGLYWVEARQESRQSEALRGKLAVQR